MYVLPIILITADPGLEARTRTKNLYEIWYFYISHGPITTLPHNFDVFLDKRSILSIAVPVAVFVVLAGFVITALLYKHRSNGNLKIHKKSSATLAALQANPLYQTLYVNM